MSEITTSFRLVCRRVAPQTLERYGISAFVVDIDAREPGRFAVLLTVLLGLTKGPVEMGLAVHHKPAEFIAGRL